MPRVKQQSLSLSLSLVPWLSHLHNGLDKPSLGLPPSRTRNPQFLPAQARLTLEVHQEGERGHLVPGQGSLRDLTFQACALQASSLGPWLRENPGREGSELPRATQLWGWRKTGVGMTCSIILMPPSVRMPIQSDPSPINGTPHPGWHIPSLPYSRVDIRPGVVSLPHLPAPAGSDLIFCWLR